MSNVLVIDNYDSFTWNLVHLIGPLCGAIDVVRNDAHHRSPRSARRRPTRSCCRPGPCTPNEAGICLDVVARALATRSRSSASASGSRRSGRPSAATWCGRPLPMHGKVSTIRARRQRPVPRPQRTASRRRATIPWWSSAPAARRRCGHGRGRRADHGAGARRAAGPRRAVPPGEHPLASRRADRANFLDIAAAWNAARDKEPRRRALTARTRRSRPVRAARRMESLQAPSREGRRRAAPSTATRPARPSTTCCRAR